MLLPDPATVPKIRRRVRHRLANWGLGEHSDVIELLVSELVTNAMRHSWGAIMSLSAEDGILRCEVQDANPAPPELRNAQEGDEGGRGMYLMDALSNAWGSYPAGVGKVVWFETPCTTETPPAEPGATETAPGAPGNGPTGR